MKKSIAILGILSVLSALSCRNEDGGNVSLKEQEVVVSAKLFARDSTAVSQSDSEEKEKPRKDLQQWRPMIP